MLEFKDQMNTVIRLEKYPSRIISLVPSQTELLYDLGLDEEVVGITKFCIFPENWFTTKTRVGGPKSVDFEKIKALQPDLIIANKEENLKEEIEQLRQIAPVWISNIETLEQSIEMILGIGKLTNKIQESIQITNAIKLNFSKLENLKKYSCLYFMWKDPYMVAGKDTFINEMMNYFGGINLQKKNRYPIWDFPSDKTPELVLLSSEPYPFAEKHVPFFKEKYPTAKIVLVEGEYFCWYGSRLRDVPNYFEKIRKEIDEN
ncbi:MAG: helical backbone metal receptor [Crocinitomicaceae bacterium]|nr:helical backbone metal receptor [Crocinitomicaceae bacterium]